MFWKAKIVDKRYKLFLIFASISIVLACAGLASIFSIGVNYTNWETGEAGTVKVLSFAFGGEGVAPSVFLILALVCNLLFIALSVLLLFKKNLLILIGEAILVLYAFPVYLILPIAVAGSNKIMSSPTMAPLGFPILALAILVVFVIQIPTYFLKPPAVLVDEAASR